MTMLKNLFSEANEKQFSPAAASLESHEGLLLLAVEDAQEINGYEAAIEGMMVSLDSLEALGATVAQSIPTGGLPKEGGAILATATKQIASTLVEDGDVTMSVEAYGGAMGSRISATTASLEGIKAWAQDLWKSIIAAFKKMYKKVKDWYLKMFSGAARMVKAAEKLRDAASKATGTADEKKLEVGSLYKALADTKSAKTFTATNLENVAELTSFFVESAVESTIALSEQTVTTIDGIKFEQADEGAADTVTTKLATGAAFDKLLDAIKAEPESDSAIKITTASEAKSKKGIMSTTGQDVKHCVALPGNKALFSMRSGEITGLTTLDADTVGKLLKCKLGFATLDTAASISDGSFDALESGGIEDLADQVIKIAQYVVDYQKRYAKLDKATAELDKSVSAFNKSVDKEDTLDTAGKALARALQRMGKHALDTITQPRQKVIAYALSTGSAALTFGSKCMGNLKA